MIAGVTALPAKLHWLFWNVEVSKLDVERDAVAILARVLERGRMEDVRWLIRKYGLPRIERFFRAGGHPEISRRTRLFWRAALKVRRDEWPEPDASRERHDALGVRRDEWPEPDASRGGNDPPWID